MSEVDLKKAPGRTGEVIEVKAAGDAIPDRCLVPDVIMAVKGQQSELLRLREVNGTAPQRTFTFSNLLKRARKNLTETELNAMRPLAFVIPDRPWRALATFVDGGIYQAWPSGRVFRVRQGVLVDAASGQRVYGDDDRHKLVRLIPTLIPRWVPPRAAAVEQDE